MQEINKEQAEQVTGALSTKKHPITTMMVGEEGGHMTTMIYGEEGGMVTTLAIGEEGGGTTTATTSSTSSALGSF
jgi:hypothetical protein